MKREDYEKAVIAAHERYTAALAVMDALDEQRVAVKDRLDSAEAEWKSLARRAR
jgi:hypothetical protein